MKKGILILTEQRQTDTEAEAAAVVQQAVTAWLVKELSK